MKEHSWLVTSSIYKQYRTYPSDGSNMWFVGLVHSHAIVEADEEGEALTKAIPLLPESGMVKIQEWVGTYTQPTGGYYEDEG